MSLALLKKKRDAIENVSGRGAKGFSLVGGYRSQGRVGQTSLSRNNNRTVFKGTEAVGSGGRYGKYVTDIITSGCNTNNSDIIKKPNITTSGYLMSRYKYPTSVLCGNNECLKEWVKRSEAEEHGQSEYIRKVRALAVCRNDKKSELDVTIECKGECKETYMIGSRRFRNYNIHKKPKNDSLDSSTYMAGEMLRKKCLPTPACKEAFPMHLNNDSCSIVYKTAEEAIAAGLLPSDWMNCRNTDPAYKTNPY